MKSRFNILPDHDDQKAKGRFPSWLHRKLPKGNTLLATKEIVKGNRLNTVCEEAKCPNLFSCWSQKTATFLIMGKECTRACGFCDINFSKKPVALSDDEPEQVANSVVALDLQHVVITQVARDDLPDGGAAHLKEVVAAIKRKRPDATIEVLTSDLAGSLDAVDKVLEANIAIFNHNVETVRRLTPRVRHKATYDRSFSILSHVKKKRPDLFVKTGIMVGLGEEEEEVKQTLADMANIGVDIVTIGQYLQASPKKLRVKSFVHPDQFKKYQEIGQALGIPYVYAGPFVRSSYNAKEVFEEVKNR